MQYFYLLLESLHAVHSNSPTAPEPLSQHPWEVIFKEMVGTASIVETMLSSKAEG